MGKKDKNVYNLCTKNCCPKMRILDKDNIIIFEENKGEGVKLTWDQLLSAYRVFKEWKHKNV